MIKLNVEVVKDGITVAGADFADNTYTNDVLCLYVYVLYDGSCYRASGFFPVEMVFTERAIPTLVAAGLEWVIVANNHISRACKVRL